MWVSGSLISSRTWRSSSVSAPSITSSIFLPRSRPRSRTSRGSLFQAMPIGCMRVFITPSCRSEVMWDSRCSGTANIDSSRMRSSCSSWLRVSTNSLTRVISSSSTSTPTRMVWAAAGASGGVSAVASAAWAASSGAASRVASCRPSQIASRAAINGASSPAGSASVAASPAMISLIRSIAASTALTSSGVTTSSPSRTRPSTFSPACATRSSRGRPRKPQVPLMVWTSRKISERVGASSGARSSRTRATSSSARLSLVSVRKSASSSSIVHSRNRRPLRAWRGVCGGAKNKR